jgi:Zn-dependent peptidase ImmA (M78 family)
MTAHSKLNKIKMIAQSIKISILFIVMRARTIEVAQKLQYVKEEKRERKEKPRQDKNPSARWVTIHRVRNALNW